MNNKLPISRNSIKNISRSQSSARQNQSSTNQYIVNTIPLSTQLDSMQQINIFHYLPNTNQIPILVPIFQTLSMPQSNIITNHEQTASILNENNFGPVEGINNLKEENKSLKLLIETKEKKILKN